jgi:DNA-binding response OmpR family regulator
MTELREFSVLIVDRSARFGSALRMRLMPLGIRVHVVDSRWAALRFAESKRIDVAVVEYAVDGWTADLCEALRERCVPYIYMAADEGADDRQHRHHANEQREIEKTLATWL